MSEVDLNDLYQKTLSGDPSAENTMFGALSARFCLFVRRRIKNREDAEEVVQNALMTISSEYPEIEVSVSFSAWAYKVLDNRIKAYWKTHARSERRTVSASDSDRSEVAGARDCNPELKRLLLGCLEKIGRANVRYARILNLKNQGYSTREICDRLGVTPVNFYSILSRARTRLGRCLERGGLL